MFENLTNPGKAQAMTLYDYNMMLRVFFQPFIAYHYSLSLPYAENFYNIVPTIILKLDRQRARSFLYSMCPAIRAS